MKQLRIYDPEVCKSDEYRLKYPELKRHEEFEALPVKGLIWVWWYANPTSPIVDWSPNKKAEEAFKRSKFTPTKAQKEDMLKGRFGDDFAYAIQKMASIDSGARFKGRKMIVSILKQYERIIELGATGFVKKTIKGEGENASVEEETDYQKYVNTSAKIAETVPMLIQKVEEGFGVALSNDGDDDEDVGGFDDDYFKSID